MTTALIPRRSAVEAASQCLYRYQQIWINGLPDENDYALRGIAFHHAANAYIRHLVEHQLASDYEESVRAFQEAIPSSLIPARLVPEVRALYDRWARNFTLDVGAFLVAEEHQESKYGFTPDLIYSRPHELEVIDFKTYFVPLTEVQAREDWQARWYILSAMQKWPNFPSYKFTFSFVRYGSSLSLTFSPGELETLERDVDVVMGMIAEAERTQVWPATPGSACSYCTLACPVVDSVQSIPKRFTVPDQAVLIAGWVQATEQNLKAAKKALKSYCATNGPVRVGDVEFDNRPVTERKYPVSAVLNVLNAVGKMGAFESETLTLSYSSLAGLFREYPDLVGRLAPYLREKQSYRFSAKFPGDEGETNENHGG